LLVRDKSKISSKVKQSTVEQGKVITQNLSRIWEAAKKNQMALLIYEILTAQVQMQIIDEGFNPTIGLSHVYGEYRVALVLDRMDPLRPVVDTEILKLILNENLTPGDFTITNEGN
jgi:CRISPR/Cas system-associated endonuclease Cas1